MLSAPHPKDPNTLYFLHEDSGLLISVDNSNGHISTINESILLPMDKQALKAALRAIIGKNVQRDTARVNLNDFTIHRSRKALPNNTPDFLTLMDLDAADPINVYYYTGALPGCPFPCSIQPIDIQLEHGTLHPIVPPIAPFYWHSVRDIGQQALNFIAKKASEFILQHSSQPT